MHMVLRLMMAGGSVMLACGATSGGASELPETVVTPPEAFAGVKAQLNEGNPLLKPAFDTLVRRADGALGQDIVSVLDDALVPPSGDKHDYMSIGPYWWPDPDTEDGLPYIRKDGEVNPERKNGDNTLMGRMQYAVRTLALAYYFTGNEAYAEHAGKLLRAWFLEPATRMNPNLNHAQAIPGRCDGRGTGIIDSVGLIDLVDRVGLLRSSQHWSDTDHAGLVAWFRDYVSWLQTSKNGKHEAEAPNNHGSWYDAQLAAFAFFAGDKELARATATAAGDKRIATQIQPDGSQPHELKRTKSWSYSLYCLNGLTTLAAVGQRLGVDLWNYTGPKGQSIGKAIAFLAPYIGTDLKWPYPQIAARQPKGPLVVLLRAAQGTGDRGYWELVDRIPLADIGREETWLRYPRPVTEAASNQKMKAKEDVMTENVEKSDLPLVVLMGDSIRMGYQNVAIRELKGFAEVWAPKENCAHTVHTLANVEKWLDGKKPALIHLNCGLHDMWRNEDGSIRHPEDVYLKNLAAIFDKLKACAPDAILVFALTTPVDQEQQKTSGYGRIVRYNEDIPKYNVVAKALALEHGLLVNDLYAVVDGVGTKTLINPDGVHFNPDGCEALGKAVAEYIRNALK